MSSVRFAASQFWCGVLALLMFNLPAHAALEVAYAWIANAGQPSQGVAAAYVRPADGSVKIVRLAVGHYLVPLGPLLTSGGNVQVSAYGAVSNSCQVKAWSGAGAEILCFNVDGKPADSQFTVLGLRAERESSLTYVWANNAAAATSVPSAQYAYDPRGQQIRSVRTAPGNYDVTVDPAVAAAGANIQVTAYGSVPRRCGVVAWNQGRIQVRCADFAGNPADAQFSLLAVHSSLAGNPFAFAWGNQPAASEYTPAAAYTHAPGVSARVQRTAPGRYRVMLGKAFANLQVTAYGADVSTAACRVVSWSDAGANIACDTPAGTPRDAQFTLLAMRASYGAGVVAPDMVRPLRPVQSRSPISLELGQRFYKSGDRVSATLDLGSALRSGEVEGVLLVGQESQDVEHLVMHRTAGSAFSDSGEHVVRAARGGAARQHDGVLTLLPGDRVVAMFYTDAARHGELEAKLVADIALFESAVGRMDAAGKPLTSPVRLHPQLATADSAAAGPGERNFGSFLVPGTLPVRVATEQVVFRPRSAADLETFLAWCGGRVLSYQAASAASNGERVEDRMYLVTIDPARARLDMLPDLRRLFGEARELLVAGEAVQRLYALLLEGRLRGFAVAANQRMAFDSVPLSRELASSAAVRATMSLSPAIDAANAWAFNALWDGDERRVNIGIIDMGFITDHPDLRLPLDGETRECSFDDDFLPDVLGRSGSCGRGRAAGPPTVGDSFFGARSWHGTGVLVTAAGVLNNRWRPGHDVANVGGGAGVAGQVGVPMLYKTGLSSYVYEMGAAMRQAVDDEASCINISAGYPCRIPSSILPDVDLCQSGGRESLCGVLLGSVSAAAATVCATVPVLAAIPIVGPILAAAAATACGATTLAAAASLPACLSFFLASGDVRSAMRVGVEYATRSGVPVIASAGNRLGNLVPAEIRPFVNLEQIDAAAWGMIPATLPSVIAVGAVNHDLMNEHLIGAALTIWAPSGTRYHSPNQTSQIPTDISDYWPQTIGATSSAAPFVTGTVALMQALDPTLDPRTPGLSSSARASIPATIRGLLRSTAVSSPDPLVRGVVSPNRALAAVAARAGIPATLPGYDTALNFNETAAAAQDTPADARLLSLGSTVTGTILAIARDAGEAPENDVDWYRMAVPATPSSGTFEVRARLRMPTASRWGRLEIAGWTLESALEVTGNETELSFVLSGVRPGRMLDFQVRGVVGQDNVYRVTLVSARHVPVVADRFEGTSSSFSHWTLMADTPLSAIWQLIQPGLTLHDVSDTDAYQITAVPPSEYFRHVPSGACAPRLEIVHPAGIDISYSTADISVPVPLDPLRRERATNPPPPPAVNHPVSVIRFAERTDPASTAFTLSYAVARGGIPTDYDLRLTFTAVKPSAERACSVPAGGLR